MSTVVCQGFQSCLDPQLIETRTLRLKLALPITSGNDFPPENRRSMADSGGWAFLQSLSSTATSQESSYIPPMIAKQSSSPLTGKSLELWTENLGSETGSEISESSGLWLASLPENNPKVEEEAEPVTKEELLQCSKSTQCGNKKVSSSVTFPPPLTTITAGGGSIQFRPHREGGRLVIKASQGPPPHPYFQAERSHGRLRLNLWKDCCSSSALDSEEEDSGNEDGDMEELEEGEGEEEEEEEEEWKVGMEKIQRGRRCREGGNGDKSLRNWEPFWVATS